MIISIVCYKNHRFGHLILCVFISFVPIITVKSIRFKGSDLTLILHHLPWAICIWQQSPNTIHNNSQQNSGRYVRQTETNSGKMDDWAEWWGHQLGRLRLGVLARDVSSQSRAVSGKMNLMKEGFPWLPYLWQRIMKSERTGGGVTAQLSTLGLSDNL